MGINKKLTESDICKIIVDANAQLSKNAKHRDIIVDQVFKLLEQNCRVLYYPLEDDDVWGFTERIKGQLFVCINTSIPYEKQIFAAAHELYHIWFDEKNTQEVLLSSNLEETATYDIDINELKANRFAAEFLAESKLLEHEMAKYGVIKSRITIKEILLLCDIFTIPYKTMVKRLYEVNTIDQVTLSELLSISEKDISVGNRILGITAPYKQDYIRLDNLIELSVDLYDKNLISYEKLDYLLSFAGISPGDVGIVREIYTPPSEDEIAGILGESDD